MDIDLFLCQDMGLEYFTLNLYIMETMFEDEYNNAVANGAAAAIQDPDTLSQAGTVDGDTRLGDEQL